MIKRAIVIHDGMILQDEVQAIFCPSDCCGSENIQNNNQSSSNRDEANDNDDLEMMTSPRRSSSGQRSEDVEAGNGGDDDLENTSDIAIMPTPSSIEAKEDNISESALQNGLVKTN